MSPRRTKSVGRKSPVANFALPIVFGALCIAVLLVGFLLWSDREVDHIALNRDRSIVSLALEETVQRVAHVQEFSTVWDTSVKQIGKRPLDLDWIDDNMGVWLYFYAGIDEIYILSPSDQPLYAMRAGTRVLPETFVAVEDAAAPLLARLRRDDGIVAASGSGGIAMLSPGQADFAILRGRPAIISAKPVVHTKKENRVAPGSEAVHIGVVFLDDGFFTRVGRQYGLSNARYQIAPSLNRKYASLPLRNREGRPIGYVVWEPFAPGSQVTSVMAPMLVIALLLSTAVIYALASRLYKRTRDLEESRIQAHHQAVHDSLTGLGNRAMFDQRCKEALEYGRRHDTLLAMLVIDLDHFKQVNDTLGHPAGDALIRQVARRLIAEVRPYDVVARQGGDEFAILISEPADYQAVEQICQRIVSQLGRPFNVSGSQTHISASIGVVIAPDHGLDLTELARKADIALYRAKAEGRSRYVVFDASMDDAVREREAIDRELRKALADCDAEFRLHFQPIFSISTGKMIGVEALLRWQHPRNGLVAPADFIRAAEESGLIEVLGQWVLRRAARAARAWPDLRVAVNVSPVQIRNPSFVETVRTILAETGLEPERLELEITETALMDATEEATTALKELRSLGVACALDDFGTGYSSLSHIRDIAVDRIKIDRSFVQAVNTPSGAALVEAIVNLAIANGLHLTAEGVENAGQYGFLARAGCHEVQGYLFARPMPAERISQMLKESRTIAPPSPEDEFPASIS